MENAARHGRSRREGRLRFREEQFTDGHGALHDAEGNGRSDLTHTQLLHK